MKVHYLLVSIVAVMVVLCSEALFIVGESQQALVLQFGKVVTEQPLYAGLHYKIPFIQNTVFFDKRILNIRSESKEIIAKDQKRLIVDSYAKYRIVDPVLFYQSVKSESILESRLLPVAEANLRENVGRVSLYDLLNEYRSVTMEKIEKGMQKDAEQFGIEIIDFRIKKADLPEENGNAVFLRMQTEREKEAKEIRAQGAEEGRKIRSGADREKRVIISDSQKDAQVLRGQGDAEAVKIFNDSLSTAEAVDFFEFYRSLDMYKNSFVKGKDNTSMILSLGNDLFKHFDVK